MDNKTNKHEFACNAGKVTEYEVKEHIDTIMVGFRGFSKEVSIVKWNDKNPVFDIRAWRVWCKYCFSFRRYRRYCSYCD